MKFSLLINGQTYAIDAENPLDISIPLRFNGAQPNAYGVEKAVSTPCEAGALVGDTRRGGSCNFEQIKMIPHCNGTHTECVGHLTHERISVSECLTDAFIPAVLISVAPENASETIDTYPVRLNADDQLITRKALEKALDKIEKPKTENQKLTPGGLIVRTLPNSESKLTKTYLDEIPPFFSVEAMRFITEMEIKHLLADLPSIDRIFDEGKLTNHRAFWNVSPGAFELNENSFPEKTVTELAFVPDEIADGKYLLNLQIAPFAADASPSRPLLFELIS